MSVPTIRDTGPHLPWLFYFQSLLLLDNSQAALRLSIHPIPPCLSVSDLWSPPPPSLSSVFKSQLRC